MTEFCFAESENISLFQYMSFSFDLWEQRHVSDKLLTMQFHQFEAVIGISNNHHWLFKAGTIYNNTDLQSSLRILD